VDAIVPCQSFPCYIRLLLDEGKEAKNAGKKIFCLYIFAPIFLPMPFQRLWLRLPRWAFCAFSRAFPVP